MSAEFYLTFADPKWLPVHSPKIIQLLKGMDTYVRRAGNEVWFRGTEKDGSPDRWPFDVRLIFQADQRILFEVSIHPPSIEADFKSFYYWLRSQTPVQVLDEDGEKTSWLG